MENILKYPQTCIVNKVVPKTMFYKFMDVNPRMKLRFVKDVTSLTWLYKLAPSTLNVSGSDSIKEIEVFVATLKGPDCSTDLFSFIDCNMPHHIVFILSYEEKSMLLINYKDWTDSAHTTFKLRQSFTSPWVKTSDLILSIQGQALDRVYDNFVAQVSGIGEHKAGTLSEIVSLKATISAKEKELQTLLTKIRKEPQFNIQTQMNKTAKEKKKEIEELKQQLNNLK